MSERNNGICERALLRLGSVLLILLGTAIGAKADPEKGARIVPAAHRGRVMRAVLPAPGSVILIPVHQEQLTTVLIPDAWWGIRSKPNKWFHTEVDGNRLRVTTMKGAPLGAQKSVKLIGFAEASFVFKVVATPAEAADVVEVIFEWEQERNEAAREAMEARIQKELASEYEQRATELRTEYEQRATELRTEYERRDVEARADYEQRLERHEESALHGFMESVDAVAGPIRETLRIDRDVLGFHLPVIAYGGDTGLLTFEVTNKGAYAVSIEEIAVQDSTGTEYTRTVQIAGRERGEERGVLEPGQTLRATVSFRDPTRLRNGLELKLSRGGGVSPAVVRVREALQQHVNKGRKSVLLSGGGGALQLERDGTSSYVGAWGLGGQLVYGAGAHWSLDIGLSGLVSGEAELDGVTRSERLYRVHGGVRYQVGEEGWIPFARVGVGGALVSQRNGGDSSFAGLVFGQAGGGVIRWLNDSFVLGAEGLLEFPFADGGYVFTAQAHLGVAWGGNEF